MGRKKKEEEIIISLSLSVLILSSCVAEGQVTLIFIQCPWAWVLNCAHCCAAAGDWAGSLGVLELCCTARVPERVSGTSLGAASPCLCPRMWLLAIAEENCSQRTSHGA